MARSAQREYLHTDESAACGYCKKAFTGDQGRTVAMTRDRRGRRFCNAACREAQIETDEASAQMAGEQDELAAEALYDE